MPYADYATSAKSLDYKRLGKQRVETYQILRALAGVSAGWTNHPATKMWRGYEVSLLEYGEAVCLEWRSRGYRDTCLEKIQALRDYFVDSGEPTWLGDPALHLSHQSNLVRKDPEYYGILFPNVPADLEYVWPIP